MVFLTYNYLGEKIFLKDGLRYVQNFDGWLPEQKNPRFFYAMNRDDLAVCAYAFVRYGHLSNYDILSYLKLIVKVPTVEQHKEWLNILEHEFLKLSRRVIPASIPKWFLEIKSLNYDLHLDHYLFNFINTYPWIFEESGCHSLPFGKESKNCPDLFSTGSFHNLKRPFKIQHYHQNNQHLLDDKWLNTIYDFKGFLIFNDLENKFLELSNIFKNKKVNFTSTKITSKLKPTCHVIFLELKDMIDLPSEICAEELMHKKLTHFAEDNIYKAKSKKGEEDSSLPAYLNLATQTAMRNLETQIKSVDDYVIEHTSQEIWNNLSAEQVDGVALGVYQMLQGGAFILGDETGKGKGRIMAAFILSAAKHKKNVVFVTEKHHLFTDIYRDMSNICKDIPPLYLLHKEAVIYNQAGDLVQKAKCNDKDFDCHQSIILTTYSQFNRKQKTNGKLDWLLAHMGGTFGSSWLLLDEAHNASGDSNISDNINKMIKKSDGVIYSSATFAKSEKNLDLYKKAIPTNHFGFSLIKKLLKQEKYSHLREIVTLGMAAEGNFVRREHLNKTVPEKILLELSEDKKQAMECFREIWKNIFILTDLQCKHMPQEETWSKVNRSLQRTVSEFLILLKIDAVPEIFDSLYPTHKPIFVMENTLESSLKNLLTNKVDWEEIDGEEKVVGLSLPAPAPLWSKKFQKIIETEISKDLWVCLNQTEKDLANRAKERIDSLCASMPQWLPSPIDYLKNTLSTRCKIDELSGRQTEIKNGVVYVKKPLERTKVIYDFNNGNTDSLIVTRTGSTGTSLHAGKNFKDQRPRAMIELEVTKNPAERIQFWGRVSRKDEVARSKVLSLVVNCPAEHRRWAKETTKYQKAASHLGANQKNSLDFLSPEADTICYEWLWQNGHIARELGIWHLNWKNKEGLADRTLGRAILLNLDKQKELFEVLEHGIAINQKAYEYKNWLGQSSESFNPYLLMGCDNKKTGLMSQHVCLTERVFNFEVHTTAQQVFDCVTEHKDEEETRQEILSVWKNAPPFYQKAYALLEQMKIGHSIFTVRPLDQKSDVGVITGFIAKEPFLANTVGVEVWFKGMPEAVCISMWDLLNDKFLKVKQEPGKAVWFGFDGTYPIVYNSLEGNPFLAAWWASKRKIGRNVNLIDRYDGVKNVMLLPRKIDYQTITKFNLDLLDPAQVVAFLNRHNKEKCFMSGDEENLELFYIDDQMVLSFEPNFYKTLDFDFIMLKYLKKAKKMNNRIVHMTNKHNLTYILHLLEARQIYWNISSIHYNWYIESFKNFKWN